ncbi:MAG: hypothetical protein FWD05_01575 [Oscillospiraceae bacterium]|nr:hypothetical protein [Oscillospiraceae bacterium]
MKFELYKIFCRRTTVVILVMFFLLSGVFMMQSFTDSSERLAYVSNEGLRQTHIYWARWDNYNTMSVIEATGNLGELPYGGWLFPRERWIPFQADVDSPIIQRIVDMYRQVEIPDDAMSYTDVWWHIFNQGGNFILWLFGLSFIVIIGVAPVFAEERSTGVDKIILTSKHGKNKLIANKIIASLLFATVIYLAYFTLITIPRLLRFNVDLQQVMQVNFAPFSQSPYSYLMSEFLIRYFAVGLLSYLLLCMMGLTISALSRNPFIAIIPSLGLFFVTLFDIRFISVGLHRFFTLFPANSIGQTDVWHVPDFYNIFGLLIDRPTMTVIFSAVSICVLAASCVLITKRMEASN